MSSRMAISAARTSSTVSSFLFLNFRILAVSFMACHGVGCAVSLTLCPFQILLLEKPREEVATDYDNDTDGYEERPRVFTFDNLSFLSYVFFPWLAHYASSTTEFLPHHFSGNERSDFEGRY